MILISCIFILNSSQLFIKENKINFFEYPIIILISILGMFIMVSSNDLILFYSFDYFCNRYHYIFWPQ